MSSVSSADVEKLIHNLEFENRQYVKEIEKEKAHILDLESQSTELEAKIIEVQHATSQLDADTKIYHRQFTQNRDNIENLKKTSALLTEHEQALKMRKGIIISKCKQDEEEHASMEAYYSRILEDYMVKYSHFPLSKVYKSAEESLKIAQERIQQLKEERDHIRATIDAHQKNKGVDFKPFRTAIKFGIKVAELKVSSSRYVSQIKGLQQEIEELERNISDKIQETELKSKMETERKEEEEALRKERLRKEEEEMRCRKEALLEQQRKDEELRLQLEKEREKKEEEERQQMELEEQMRKTKILQEPLHMNPPSQLPRRSPLKMKIPVSIPSTRRNTSTSGTLLREQLQSSVETPSPRRSPPKMTIPRSPLRIPTVQTPNQKKHIDLASLNIPLGTCPSTPNLTPSPGRTKTQIPVISSASFASQTHQITPPVLQSPKVQESSHPETHIPPVPRESPSSSPQAMEIQDQDPSVISESPKDELLEDGPKTPARNVDGEEDENYYDPRTPGGSMDMEQHLKKLKSLQSSSPLGFSYIKRPMYKDHGDEIEAESAKGETQSANLFGAGDSTKFETAFQFGPSFNAGNNVNSSVFASPPGKGASDEFAPTSSASNINMFGEAGEFSFSGQNTGINTVFNMFGDAPEAAHNKEENSSTFNFSFGSPDMNAKTTSSNFSLF